MPIRAAARLAFAQAHLFNPLTLAPASSDASFRSYWRSTDANGAHFIVMDAPPEKENCAPFIDVSARLHAAGLCVPKVLAKDLTQGFLLLPDLGTRTLLPELQTNSVEIHYGDALATILQMQLHGSVGGLPSYDAPRLDAEMELFPEWFLRRHLGVTPSCEEFDVIEAAMMHVRNLALMQPKVFVHRDFHSRNLMISTVTAPAHQRLAVIDFQDAVCGPITYDLVSLLRDCYIRWPEADVARWVESYRILSAQAGLHSADAATFKRWFDWMGVQRHLKVLGIFARLNYRDGKSSYLKDLGLVLDYTVRVCLQYNELRPFACFLEKLTRGIDLSVARQTEAVSGAILAVA
jgi:N-acetylmuramate 1-kinase